MEFKKRLLMEIGIPVLVLVVMAGALIFVGNDISAKVKAVGEKRADLNSRLAIADSLSSLKKDSEQIQTYYIALQSILPRRDNLALFPRDLSDLGKQNNLDINITLGQGAADAADPMLWATSFKITGAGSLNNFLVFIKSLNSDHYLVSISELDFVKEGDIFRALLGGKVFSS